MTAPIDSIGFLPAAREIAFGDAPGGASSTDFASWMSKELGAVNDRIAGSDQLLQRLAAGEVDSLHQVMIGLEEAKLSFQLMVAVRNRLLEAYQDVMRMQV